MNKSLVKISVILCILKFGFMSPLYAQNGRCDTIDIGDGAIIWHVPDEVQPVIYIPDMDCFSGGVLISGNGSMDDMAGTRMAGFDFVSKGDTMEIIMVIRYKSFMYIDGLSFKEGKFFLSTRSGCFSIQKGDVLIPAYLKNIILTDHDRSRGSIQDIFFEYCRIGENGLILEPYNRIRY